MLELKLNEMKWNGTKLNRKQNSQYIQIDPQINTHNAEQMEINQIDMKQKKKENNYKLRF